MTSSHWTLLCSSTNLHEVTEEAKVLKILLYQNLPVKLSLSGLRDPLLTIIWCLKLSDPTEKSAGV